MIARYLKQLYWAAWSALRHQRAFLISARSSVLWSCNNVTVRGASWAIPQMHVKKVSLVPSGAPAGHLGGIWEASGDDLQMSCRCPLDAFSDVALAGHLGAYGAI